MAAIQECVKVQNKIGLCLNFYEKFSKLWDSLGIRDRSVQHLISKVNLMQANICSFLISLYVTITGL